MTLENDATRVILLPQVGGKIWTATDKKTGRDFLFTNHVMKFRDIAIRGPWTAGGIEFNYRASRRNGDTVLADLGRAKGLGDDWRIGRQFAAYYEGKEDFAKMLEVTSEYLKRWPERDPIRLAHANALLKLKRYRDCIAYLETVNLLPSEHAGNASGIWHAAQDALGLARTWPENLGKGEPYPDAK